MNLSTSTYPTVDFERNIIAVYHRATDADIITGLNWYTSARDFAANLLDGDVRRATGIIAAFSPQLSWKMNTELAVNCIANNRFTGHYPANNVKARKIFDGKEPLKVLGGNKVRAFYHCILSAGKTEEVCVDRHAVAVCLGRVATEDERHSITDKRYRTYAQAYRNAAKFTGHTPAQLQAIVWVAWRREKGLVD